MSATIIPLATMTKPVITAEMIEQARTPRGGWSYNQLTAWGVPVPPPKGWKKALIAGKPIPEKRQERKPPSLVEASTFYIMSARRDLEVLVSSLKNHRERLDDLLRLVAEAAKAEAKKAVSA